MTNAQPDFTRFEAAITRQRLPDRVPLGELEVDFPVMEAFLGRPIADLQTYCAFWEQAGYDYVILQVRGQWLSDSFQIKISQGVLDHDGPASASTFETAGVCDRESFETYPWIGAEGVYYRDVDLIEKVLPHGMKVIVNVGPLFSGVWRCMGLEAFSLACVEQPALVEAVVQKMGGLLVAIVRNVVQRDIVGGIWLGDDIAYTQSLMASPAFLRSHIFPYYEKVGALCRQYGKLCGYHSDGLLTEVFDDLLDCGIQAVHPNEPTSVDIVELKRRWGQRVSFVGNIDVDLLTRGTPDDVARAAGDLIENAAPGGGFALGSGNSVTKNVPLANYRAMLDTVRLRGNIYG